MTKIFRSNRALCMTMSLVCVSPFYYYRLNKCFKRVSALIRCDCHATLYRAETPGLTDWRPVAILFYVSGFVKLVSMRCGATFDNSTSWSKLNKSLTFNHLHAPLYYTHRLVPGVSCNGNTSAKTSYVTLNYWTRPCTFYVFFYS